ncbi:hypothetical protein [Psychrobacter sp. UBA3068]|mgnify:FL=1|nr:hypothetical protein [Psychrobacter sp. UBA3068]
MSGPYDDDEELSIEEQQLKNDIAQRKAEQSVCDDFEYDDRTFADTENR